MCDGSLNLTYLFSCDVSVT